MRWQFDNEKRNIKPKDSSIKDFSKHLYQSAVREAIQNSIDATITGQRTKVKLNFFTAQKTSIPDIDNLVQRIYKTKEYWKENPAYVSLLDNMLKTYQSFRGQIPILEISDFNTNGMTLSHPSGDPRRSNYYGFSRGNNSVKGDENTGGSEGEGKAAYYALSSLRTIFVHSISRDGNIFEGLTRLGTHIFDGEYNSAYGYLGQNTETPIKDYYSIPPIFRKREQYVWGTSIYIPGLWNRENSESELIKSVINNFWLSIHEDNLEVTINNEVLNSDSLEQLIRKYLPERKESSRTKSNPEEYGRSLCYYETWLKRNEKSKDFDVSLPKLGNVIFKISKHPDYPGKIAFFRKQKMLILKSRVNQYISKGFCGVFLCADDEGNKKLQKMEGKAHTEWDPNYWTEDPSEGKAVLRELHDFLKISWTNYISQFREDELDIPGLEKIGAFGKKGNARGSTPGPKKGKTKPSPGKDFKKNGFYVSQTTSSKRNQEWIYTVSIYSSKEKETKFAVIVGSDSVRSSQSEIVKIKEAYGQAEIEAPNIINYRLKEGNNIIEFVLDSKLRHALKFDKK